MKLLVIFGIYQWRGTVLESTLHRLILKETTSSIHTKHNTTKTRAKYVKITQLHLCCQKTHHKTFTTSVIAHY